MSKSVINKGKFNLPQISNFVSLVQFIFVKEDEQNFLLLKLHNDRDEIVTNVTLEITQKNSKGLPLSTIKLNCPINNGKAKSSFILNNKIALEDACADFTVKILSAHYGNYKYTVSGDELMLSYQKTTGINQPNYSSPRLNGSVKTIAARNFKIPVIISVAMIVALALSIVFTYFYLQNFKEENSFFLHSGVRYAFANDDKSLDSQIYVVGSNSGTKEIIIPQKVKGHEVAGITQGAFTNNSTITKIIINAPIKILSSTFINCSRLTYANLDKVTEIGRAAFSNCYNLKEVVAKNLNKIEEFAFSNCTNLTNVEISNSESVLKLGTSAFGNCNRLTDFSIDQWIDYSLSTNFLSGSYNIERLYLKNFNYSYEFKNKIYSDSGNSTIADLLGAYSYSNLKNPKELTIEYCDIIANNFCYNLPLNTVTIKNLTNSVVGERAFSGCSNLSKLDVPIAITHIGNEGFFQTAITSFDTESLEYIGDNAFGECLKLENFNLSGNEIITYIGEGAFYKCISLKNFYLPETITELNKNLFKDCTSLSKLSLSDTITRIGEYALAGCNQITTLTVPKSVISIGLGAFSNCTALKEITLPFIGGSVYNNNYLTYVFGSKNSTINVLPSSLQKVTINEANVIADNAFYNCSYVKEIIIESYFTRIGNSAFYGCKNLNSFIIPVSVSNIGSNAFTDCYRLYEVYNLSSLNILPSSSNYGNAGYSALKVYKSLSEQPISKFSYDGYEFGLNHENVWLLLNYSGTKTSLILPKNLSYNNAKINNYQINKYMLADNNAITNVTVTDNVTQIGENAFKKCTALTTVNVPTSVTLIGKGAFEGCNKIKDMVLPFIGNSADSNRFFSFIFGALSFNSASLIPSSLKNVTITQAADIPDFAFYGIKDITAIKLPNNYTKIGESAFFNCKSLTSFSFPANLISIGNGAFKDCGSLKAVTLPNSVSTIGLNAFNGCVSLTEMKIPFVGETASRNRYFSYIFGGKNYYETNVIPPTLTSVTVNNAASIAEKAFYNCYNITNITLTNGLEQIGDNAFVGCARLQKIEFPPSVKSIGISAFYSCESLKKVTVNSVIDIKESAFENCSRLYEVYNFGGMKITEGSKDSGYIGYYAIAIYTSSTDEPLKEAKINGIVFNYIGDKWSIVDYEGNATKIELGSFTYGGKTISSYSIKNRAFDSSFITDLIIGKEVTSIGEYAFSNCSYLKSVIFINSGITEIKEGAFYYCVALEKVVLPQGLQRIGSNAFYMNLQLYTITIPQTVNEIAASAFENCYALCDVYNLSETLNVVKGSWSNGYLAYYALRVSTSLDIEALDTVVADKCRFMFYENNWYMIAAPINSTSAILALPKTFIYNGATITTYILMEYALSNASYQEIYLPQSVVKIINSAQYINSSTVIHYGGSQNQWQDLMNALPNSLLKNLTIYYNMEIL